MNPDIPHMLDCPFCGGNPAVMSDRVGMSNLFDVWIECYRCGARTRRITSGPKKEVPECTIEAAKAWNRRPGV